MKSPHPKKFVCLFPSPLMKGLTSASQKAISDMVKFSSEFLFKPVFLGRRNEIKETPRYYLTMIKTWFNADVILTIYPYICINLRRNYLLRKMESVLISCLNKNVYSILYIVDLPIERAIISDGLSEEECSRACEIEKRVFDSFNILLVFNEAMKRKIQERYGFNDDKFVLFEVLDYWVEDKCTLSLGLRKPVRIAFLGSNLNQKHFSWIKEVPSSKEVTFSFFGINGEWINNLKRENIRYEGFIPPESVPKILKGYHFGLIYYDISLKKYLQYGSTSKFSAYVAAGLPVLSLSIIPYLTQLIERYGVGLTFNSLTEIPNVISNLNETEYRELRKNCAELGEKIRQGYFLKRALNVALHKLKLCGL